MAHPDLDRLLSFCIPFAQDQLKKNNGFHPFAAVINSEGAIEPLALEHFSGDCVMIYLSYEKKLLRGYQFGEMIASLGTPTIFG